MARIIAIDYGLKRTGLAWTDPLQIIATALEAVATTDLIGRIRQIVTNEQVETIVLGLAKRLDGSDTDTTKPVMRLEKQLREMFPELKIVTWDEQFSSKAAMSAMIQAGVPKKKRRDKGLIDKTSATIILQDYLSSKTI
jgi:putative holliday junction resolvase